MVFANVPVEAAAGRLAELMERYRPQVVVTYDENGGYGHPDHIQAHRIAMAATEASGIPRKLYYTAVPRERMAELFEYLRSIDAAPEMEFPEDFGVPEAQITTVVDVASQVDRKVKALEAHASQGENIFFLRMPAEAQHRVFATESFVRQVNHVPEAADHEDDLFDGLR